MLNSFAAQHDNERFATVCINVGNRVAKTLNQFSTTFLHGKTSFEFLFVISVFLFFYADVASKKSLFCSQSINKLKI